MSQLEHDLYIKKKWPYKDSVHELIRFSTSRFFMNELCDSCKKLIVTEKRKINPKCADYFTGSECVTNNLYYLVKECKSCYRSYKNIYQKELDRLFDEYDLPLTEDNECHLRLADNRILDE